jgi:SnoaL-like domain
VTDSPIDQLLRAIDRLDVEAVMALMAPECRLLTVDGRRAEGTAAARELLTDFLARLRSSTHRITDQWHLDNVWIAEVEATYELRDSLEMSALPRAFVARDGPDGLVDLHVYGAHERPLADHRTGDEGIRIGGCGCHRCDDDALGARLDRGSPLGPRGRPV